MKIPTSGGIIVIVVTTIAGVLIALATSTELKSGLESFKQGSTVPGTFIVLSFWGGAIGATVGSLLWCLIINMVCRDNNAEELSPMPSSIMSPIEKTLIVVLGGMILMVFTTVYGAATGLYLTIDDLGDYALNMYIYTIVGGVVGAVVAVCFGVCLATWSVATKKQQSMELPQMTPHRLNDTNQITHTPTSYANTAAR